LKELELLRKIKSVAFATVDDNKPVVRIIDVMLVEDEKIYFTTARGKSFYRQLVKSGHVSITGIDENYVSIRVTGTVELAHRDYIDEIFKENPMMNDLYPGEKRNILEPFCISKGVGEVFNLSNSPIIRKRFEFGDAKASRLGYKINNNCKRCDLCRINCSFGAITKGDVYEIISEKCLECGMCKEVCKFNAVETSPGLTILE
jgi:uncharacterized pyridoxamine 5'-phosphate oxidase family protein/Pyruvate/2-oxoacid:ferredoxin oxidoreductase delta subunit